MMENEYITHSTWTTSNKLAYMDSDTVWHVIILKKDKRTDSGQYYIFQLCTMRLSMVIDYNMSYSVRNWSVREIAYICFPEFKSCLH